MTDITYRENNYGFYEIYYKNRYIGNAVDNDDLEKKISIISREKVYMF